MHCFLNSYSINLALNLTSNTGSSCSIMTSSTDTLLHSRVTQRTSWTKFSVITRLSGHGSTVREGSFKTFTISLHCRAWTCTDSGDTNSSIDTIIMIFARFSDCVTDYRSSSKNWGLRKRLRSLCCGNFINWWSPRQWRIYWEYSRRWSRMWMRDE